MGKHTLLKLLLFSLIIFHGVDASFVRSFRKLIDSNPIKDSPDPNNTVGEEKKKEETPSSTNDNKIDANVSSVPPPQPQSSPKVENNSDVNQKENNSTTNTPLPVTATTPPPVPVPVPVSATAPPPPPVPAAAPPPPPVPATALPPVPKKTEDGVNEGKDQEEKKGKDEEIKFSHSTTNDTCDGLNTCTDDGVMAACISIKDSKNLVVLLRNRGDGSIKVKLRSDYESNLGDVEVDKNKTEKVTINRINSENTQLTLDAGKGDCVLHTATPIPEESYFLHFPSYDKILTPINGAYFLIFTVLVFGGICACCMFRKKHRDEIPYQELEMALPESASATNIESAEGWDQVWDDDWDDNVAVKSPSVRHAGSISANGLTARSLNKDGWEDNWDD